MYVHWLLKAVMAVVDLISVLILVNDVKLYGIMVVGLDGMMGVVTDYVMAVWLDGLVEVVAGELMKMGLGGLMYVVTDWLAMMGSEEMK